MKIFQQWNCIGRNLQHKNTFDDERRQVIRHWGSCNVQACPGSGKTTTLVAKVLILLEKMPRSQGICVLSHTNAAREEIVAKLGLDADRLLRPPHFVGTIHHFVNQFLGIPGAAERFGVRPWAIDDAAYAARARRRYYEDIPPNIRFALKKSQEKLLKQNRVNEWDSVARLRFSYQNPSKLVLLSDSGEKSLS
jgi:DNA helicase II / ATP-dependent DNA helicase PcrA